MLTVIKHISILGNPLMCYTNICACVRFVIGQLGGEIKPAICSQSAFHFWPSQHIRVGWIAFIQVFFVGCCCPPTQIRMPFGRRRSSVWLTVCVCVSASVRMRFGGIYYSFSNKSYFSGRTWPSVCCELYIYMLCEHMYGACVCKCKPLVCTRASTQRSNSIWYECANIE